jgi:hypothetical protein
MCLKYSHDDAGGERCLPQLERSFTPHLIGLPISAVLPSLKGYAHVTAPAGDEEPTAHLAQSLSDFCSHNIEVLTSPELFSYVRNF